MARVIKDLVRRRWSGMIYSYVPSARKVCFRVEEGDLISAEYLDGERFEAIVTAVGDEYIDCCVTFESRDYLRSVGREVPLKVSVSSACVLSCRKKLE